MLPISRFNKRAGRPCGTVSQCKQCTSKKQRDWVGKNKDTPRFKANAAAYTRRWRDKNVDRYNAYQATYRVSTARKVVKTRYLQTPHGAAVARKDARKRRQWKKGVTEIFTKAMEEALREAFQDRCFITGETNEAHKQRMGQSLHVDHVEPLKNGAALTFDNACLLTIEQNSRKGLTGWAFFSPAQQRKMRRLQEKAKHIYEARKHP